MMFLIKKAINPLYFRNRSSIILMLKNVERAEELSNVNFISMEFMQFPEIGFAYISNRWDGGKYTFRVDLLQEAMECTRL